MRSAITRKISEPNVLQDQSRTVTWTLGSARWVDRRHKRTIALGASRKLSSPVIRILHACMLAQRRQHRSAHAGSGADTLKQQPTNRRREWLRSRRACAPAVTEGLRRARHSARPRQPCKDGAPVCAGGSIARHSEAACRGSTAGWQL